MSVQRSKNKTLQKIALWSFAVLMNALLMSSVNAKDDTLGYVQNDVKDSANLKPAITETEQIPYARLGEKIRQNKVDVGSIYSVSDKNGRFHNIHADKLLMDCSQCHGLRVYKADYLLVSKYKELPAEHKGRVEKVVCLGCHLPGGMGTPWYGGSTIKEPTYE